MNTDFVYLVAIKSQFVSTTFKDDIIVLVLDMATPLPSHSPHILHSFFPHQSVHRPPISSRSSPDSFLFAVRHNQRTEDNGDDDEHHCL